MNKIRYIGLLVFCSLLLASSQAAQKWTTHFAYNHVQQIAVASDRVYALSDGSLFSVDKQTEQIKVYSNQSGLHSTGITCIHYDQTGRQLIIGYGTGKMDLLSANGVKYIGELYDKDMTQLKTIYNVTLKGRLAYLSTAYGIQTLDLREGKLVDSYWLRPGGQETEVKDVLLTNDSIYAFTDDSLFCAAMSDNLVDYTVWHREPAGRIARDEEKGVHYVDGSTNWYASEEEGIVRVTPTARLSYKPQGPLNNNPYRLTAKANQVWVVSGGRWDNRYSNPGQMMHYDGNNWVNVPSAAIKAKINQTPFDFMNVAVDPNDIRHYYVTSYGTGLYEFRNDNVVRHDIAGGDNSLVSIIASNPNYYTRLDGATYDANGNLWMLDACVYDQLQCIAADGTWHALNIMADNANVEMHTPAGLVIDRMHPNYKWMATARYNTCICLMDDRNTAFDTSDDRVVVRTEWLDQDGKSFKPEFILAIMQDSSGRLWMITEKGAAYIDSQTDYFQSEAVIRPAIMDTNGENPITSLWMNAICETPDGNIWLGSDNMGVYVLDHACTTILAHYVTENSALPSNAILSLASDENGIVWIGTGEGLVRYDPAGWEEGVHGSSESDDPEWEMGSMQQWKLHLSYTNPQEIAATPSQIFAAANGSLFSVDRADESIVYWNKATGLSGSSVAHIAYDAASEQLMIAYENGQIDLLSDAGDVTQMPDISMKAGSIAVTVNSICVGSKYIYLAMPFGIIAIQPRKAEVTDTYYIGQDAASVEVQQVVEMGDSLYAFSYDMLYKAALKDNLVDYSFWHSEMLPFEQIQQAVVYNRQLMVLAHDSLYRREGTRWQLMTAEQLAWVHVSGNQLLAYQNGKGLLQWADDSNKWLGLSANYVATDAVYSNGEYWLAEQGKGLVRLSTAGDALFRPEGPMNNFGYHLDVAHDQLYVAPGGRWSEMFGRPGDLSIYDGQNWRTIPSSNTWYFAGHPIQDPVGFGVDPADPGHFFVATYSTGLFEFKDYKAVQHYDSINSKLRKVIATVSDRYFTWTDGVTIDEQGNCWLLNATASGWPLHVITPQGQWCALPLTSGGQSVTLTTPSGTWIDRRNAQLKWFFDQRVEPRVFLLDDGGTPTVSGDDRCMARSVFVDQNGNTLTPSFFFCFAQDRMNRIWLGTEKGVLIIPSTVDFFKSNTCHRIIIPRNDGTGLGDYLLGNEQINCMAVDGGNRIWIGTANSGLYLIEDDTITVAHFTENNSLLPSDNIQSIAIFPKTGEVFVGTDRGIASYRSDASEPAAKFSDAYAYPNPVRPNYGGMISICGLKENTVVNIIDSGGNLVCKTHSNGGTAVWDGKLPDGRRATPGVYTALCNAKKGHTIVKILIAR